MTFGPVTFAEAFRMGDNKPAEALGRCDVTDKTAVVLWASRPTSSSAPAARNDAPNGTSFLPWCLLRCINEPLARRIDPAQTAPVTISTKVRLHGVLTPHLDQHPRLTRTPHSPLGAARSIDAQTPIQVWIGTFA